MKINTIPALDFDDVLITPKRSRAASRKEVVLEREFKFYHSRQTWKGVPIISSNMDTTGTFEMAKSLARFKCLTCLHKFYSAEQIIHFLKETELFNYIFVSIGIKESDIEKIQKIIIETEEFGPVNICIDVANGYTDDFVNFCARVRKLVGDTPIIMAGNIATPEMVQELILHGGIDIAKVGLGSGSQCITRLKTGIGVPQLTCCIECSHAAHGLKSDEKRLGLICSDGGCKIPADICKGLGASSDFVMLGGMLMGVKECEGEWELSGGIKKSLLCYGMSSKKAQEKYSGGMESYKSSEGRIKQIPYKGPVSETIQDILGGLRSCCAYIGATSLKDLSKCTEFRLVNRVHYDTSI